MPMYEYRCGSCGYAYEKYEGARSAGKMESCPKCGAGKVERVFSTFSSSCLGGTGTVTSGGSGCSGHGGFS